MEYTCHYYLYPRETERERIGVPCCLARPRYLYMCIVMSHLFSLLLYYYCLYPKERGKISVT